MKKLELELVFNEKNLVAVELDETRGLCFVYEDESREYYPTFADELFLAWLTDALAHNQVDMALKVLNDIKNAEKRVVTEDMGNDPEPPADSDDVPPHDEPEDEFRTIKDVYTYITSKNNPLDKDLILKLVDELGGVETFGGQAFHVNEVYLPVDEREKVYCRFLVAILDGQDDGAFLAIPTTWESVAAYQEVDDLNYEELNSDISLNLICSEALVFEDPDTFNKDLGEFYVTGNAFFPPDGVPTVDEHPDEPSTPEDTPPEDGDPEPDEPVDAEIKNLETDSTTTDFGFESVIKYTPKSGESWLNEFTITDEFKPIVSSFKERLDKYLKKTLREHLTVMMSEKENFIAVRIDKEGLLDSTITKQWFKKRLTKLCDAVRHLSKGLRIVETRGSYYTRTFFLVEAIPDNYCLSETDLIKEVDLREGKSLYESNPVTLNEAFLSAITSANQSQKFVVKPGLKTRSGQVVESYKVNNDGKIPYAVYLDEGTKILFINESIEPVKEILNEDPSEDSPSKEDPVNETTQPSDVTPPGPVGDGAVLRDTPWDYKKEDLVVLLSNCEEQVEALGGGHIRAALCETKLGKHVVYSVDEDYGFVCPGEQCGMETYNNPFVIVDLEGQPTSFGADLDDRLYRIADFLLF